MTESRWTKEQIEKSWQIQLLHVAMHKAYEEEKPNRPIRGFNLEDAAEKLKAELQEEMGKDEESALSDYINDQYWKAKADPQPGEGWKLPDLTPEEQEEAEKDFAAIAREFVEEMGTGVRLTEIEDELRRWGCPQEGRFKIALAARTAVEEAKRQKKKTDPADEEEEGEEKEEPNSLIRERRFRVPRRPEDWVESEEYPGWLINSSGEVMDWKSGKVRKISTAFNPNSGRWGSRVYLGEKHKNVYHGSLLVERQKILKRRKKAAEDS